MNTGDIVRVVEWENIFYGLIGVVKSTNVKGRKDGTIKVEFSSKDTKRRTIYFDENELFVGPTKIVGMYNLLNLRRHTRRFFF